MLGQLHLPSLQQALRGHMLTRLGPLYDSRSDDNLTLVVVGNQGDALAERLRLTHPDLTVIRHGKSALAPVDIAGTVRRAAGSDRILLAFLDEEQPAVPAIRHPRRKRVPRLPPWPISMPTSTSASSPAPTRCSTCPTRPMPVGLWPITRTP